ncbi:MAG: hypothetical protein IJ078_05630 [Succinivibrionaceae bacterium]|nr:hypothetical protein [Succinivibrionaceae bacterium]
MNDSNTENTNQQYNVYEYIVSKEQLVDTEEKYYGSEFNMHGRITPEKIVELYPDETWIDIAIDCERVLSGGIKEELSATDIETAKKIFHENWDSEKAHPGYAICASNLYKVHVLTDQNKNIIDSNLETAKEREARLQYESDPRPEFKIKRYEGQWRLNNNESFDSETNLIEQKLNSLAQSLEQPSRISWHHFKDEEDAKKYLIRFSEDYQDWYRQKTVSAYQLFNADNELIATEIKAPDEVREKLGYPPVVNKTYKVYQYEIDVNHLVPNDGKNYGSELNLHGRITPAQILDLYPKVIEEEQWEYGELSSKFFATDPESAKNEFHKQYDEEKDYGGYALEDRGHIMVHLLTDQNQNVIDSNLETLAEKKARLQYESDPRPEFKIKRYEGLWFINSEHETYDRQINSIEQKLNSLTQSQETNPEIEWHHFKDEEDAKKYLTRFSEDYQDWYGDKTVSAYQLFNADNELIATEIKAPDEVREQLGYPPVVKNEQIEEFQQEQKQLTEEQQVTEQENKQGFFKRLFRR